MQRERFLNWINDHWLDKRCECCQQNNWAIHDQIVTPMNIIGNSHHLGNLPQVILICRNCGNIKYFSAILTGALDRPSTNIEENGGTEQ